MTHIRLDDGRILRDLLRTDTTLGPNSPGAYDKTVFATNHTVAGTALLNILSPDTAIAMYLELDPQGHPGDMVVRDGNVVLLEGETAQDDITSSFSGYVGLLRRNLPPPRQAYCQTKVDGHLLPATSKYSPSAGHCSDITEVLKRQQSIAVVSLRECDRSAGLFLVVGASFTSTPQGYVCRDGTARFGYMSKIEAARVGTRLEKRFLI